VRSLYSHSLGKPLDEPAVTQEADAR
jgi:hypothetical protein